MTDDPILGASSNVKLRKAALFSTTKMIRRRLDPRLIVSDAAKLVVTHSVAKAANLSAQPAVRNRALLSAAFAAVTAIGLRVIYRNSMEKRSLEIEDDVTRTG